MSSGTSIDEGFPTSYDSCLRQLETLPTKYPLPDDVQSRVEDVVDVSRDHPDRDRTAERCSWLIMYLFDTHPDYRYADQLRGYLNGVMADLYGNDAR